ncbi:MAG: YibE/F family protein [Candidatus Roizmanbacteria bacterium]|nr:MAG: YibE/F family protein [Candidatus Roizmanbacteria bacterium]
MNSSYNEAQVLEIMQGKVKLKLLKGELKDKTFDVNLDEIKKINFNKGDHVSVSYSKSPSGQERVFINDYVRTNEILLLFFIFLALVFLIGRWKGITSFFGMIFTFVIIGGFIIPNILLGNDPVLISLLGALFIIPITFYLGHGFNRKTTIALSGTFIALVITGILSYIFVKFTRLTGFASEEAAYLQVIQGENINVVSLLLAGIIIGAMGVLDDITIAQTAIVERLKIANPKYRFRELYKQAMIVGRDHIASLVNTLILVYAGASLPLFLLFYNSKMPYSTALNSEIITTEIVRTLVSSIGIILAVPITTFIAGMFLEKKT